MEQNDYYCPILLQLKSTSLNNKIANFSASSELKSSYRENNNNEKSSPESKDENKIFTKLCFIDQRFESLIHNIHQGQSFPL